MKRLWTAFFAIPFILSALLPGAAFSDGAPVIEIPEEAVFRKVLDNGLVILAKEDPRQDIVSVHVIVKAGLIHEGEYLGSGISHFTEHMLFKGTGTRRPGEIEREIKSYGGFINGGTSQDMTEYHIAVPAGGLAGGLSVLKDMLFGSVFDEGELRKEQAVILNEIALNRDDPQYRLTRLLSETAYLSHPYRHPVIGYARALKSLKRADLMRYHYRRYTPDNMVVAVVGGADAAGAAAMVEKGFGRIDRASPGFAAYPAEPAQIIRRADEERMPQSLAYLAMAFHSTGILDRDLFALDVLAMILGCGDNSRLNKSLFKEKRLVHAISASNHTPKDPGLFVVSAVLEPHNLAAAEANILAEIGRVRSAGITDEELEQARRTAISGYILSRQTIEDAAADLARNEVLTGSRDFSRRYVDEIRAVSKDDVKTVAGVYLNEENMTVARIVPETAEGAGRAKRAAPAKKKAGTVKETLPNGLRILVREDNSTPTVSITAAMLGGGLSENADNNGISNLTARMLLKGTPSRDESRIRGALEYRGGSMDSFSGHNSFGITMTFLKDDLDLSLDILEDVLENSSFPDNELDKEKNLVLAMIRDEDDNMAQRAHIEVMRQLFKGHPYGLRPLGEESSVSRLTRADMADYFKKRCAANNLVISVSGDVNAEGLMKKLKSVFEDLRHEEAPPDIIMAERPAAASIRDIEMDRQEGIVMTGFVTIPAADPDRYAFDLLGSMLSGSSGRLFNSLRDKEALAYSLGCTQKRGPGGGYFLFYAATTRDRLARTRKALTDEIGRIRRNGADDGELALAKKELVSQHKLKLQTNESFSMESALDELYGLGCDNLYKYEEGIKKVTNGDIKRIARKYFDMTGCAEVTIVSRD